MVQKICIQKCIFKSWRHFQNFLKCFFTIEISNFQKIALCCTKKVLQKISWIYLKLLVSKEKEYCLMLFILYSTMREPCSYFFTNHVYSYVLTSIRLFVFLLIIFRSYTFVIFINLWYEFNFQLEHKLKYVCFSYIKKYVCFIYFHQLFLII